MLAAMLAAVATGASANGTAAISPHAAHFLQSSLISLVLENVPHNYTRDRPREQAENIPLQIRRATEYILAHAQETIAVQDVAHAAGIGLRTLQQNFQKFFQTSPQDYIRTAKLRGARRDLEDPNSLLSVEEIARKWGFGNRGHFAAQYRKLYRERPSETRSTR